MTAVISIIFVVLLVVVFVEIRLEQLYKTIEMERHEREKWLCDKIAECAYVNDVDRLSKELYSFESKTDERLMKMNDLNERISELENTFIDKEIMDYPKTNHMFKDKLSELDRRFNTLDAIVKEHQVRLNNLEWRMQSPTTLTDKPDLLNPSADSS